MTLNLGAGTHFFDLPGARLAYDVSIPSGSPISGLLVLINGFQRPRSDYRAFRRRLASLCPQVATLTFDNRGSGETELFEPECESSNLMERMALDAMEITRCLTDQLGIAHPIVLGISMGGMIAQSAVLADPQLFAGLVLVSTTPGAAPTFPRPDFTPWPTLFEPMQARMARYFGPKFLKSSPLLVETMSRNMLKSVLQGKSDSHSRMQFGATQLFDVRAKLCDVNVPALILCGDSDNVMPLGQSQSLKKLIPKSDLRVYEGAGHLLLVEAPEAFVQDVATFLGDKFNWDQNHS